MKRLFQSLKEFAVYPEGSESLCNVFFKKDFIYLFLESGEGREKEGEKHQCVVAS